MMLNRLRIFLLAPICLLLSAGCSQRKCADLGPDKVRQIESYVRQQFSMTNDASLVLKNAVLVPGTCFREIRLSSTKWQHDKSMYLSEDQGFLTPALLNLKSHPFKGDARTETSSVSLPLNLDRSPLLGDPHASVTIIEFSDFECPFCKRLNDELINDVLPHEGKRVRLGFKFFPLEFHPWALYAAEAGYCAAQQNPEAFWRLNDFLFDHQSEITADSVREEIDTFLSQDRRLNGKQLHACAADPTTHSAIERDIAVGKQHFVRGTPTLFINGKAFTGARPVEELEQAIDEAAGSQPRFLASSSNNNNVPRQLPLGSKCEVPQ